MCRCRLLSAVLLRSSSLAGGLFLRCAALRLAAAGIPIAAGVLYLTFGLLLSPMITAAALALSSVSVLTNALRLRAQQI